MTGISEDKFSSAAGYYTDYRKPYPAKLFDLVRSSFNLDGSGELLDVGCGTGQIAVPMSGDFARILGVDISTEMINNARNHALATGISNVEFSVMPAEEIGSISGPFDLVTFGSALHWMDIAQTLALAAGLLRLGGGVALLDMRSIWGGSTDWEQTVVQVVQKWMRTERKAGSSTFQASTNPKISYEDALETAGLDVFDSGSIETSYLVDIPFIIGHLYTTSYCNKDLLGSDAPTFEQELARAFEDIQPDGQFEWTPRAGYIFARK